MTKTVWKFTLTMLQVQPVRMPVGARILHVAVQRDDLCLWAWCDPAAPTELRMIEIAGTGHDAPSFDEAVPIGSVLVNEGSLVWHIFDRGVATE